MACQTNDSPAVGASLARSLPNLVIFASWANLAILRPGFPNSAVMLLGKRNVVTPAPAPRIVTGDEPFTMPVITYLIGSNGSSLRTGGEPVGSTIYMHLDSCTHFPGCSAARP